MTQTLAIQVITSSEIQTVSGSVQTPIIKGLKSYKLIILKFLVNGHLTAIWVFFLMFFFQLLHFLFSNL
jgi:hypothetical protein